MKQHITSKQLKELNFEEIDVLIHMTKTKLISIPNNKKKWEEALNTNRKLTEYHSFIKELNIGKLIEILRNNVVIMEIKNDYGNENDIPYEWWIVEYNYRGNKIKHISKKLIDALWEAVKNMILENLSCGKKLI